MKEQNVESTDEKGFKPHITLLKLSKAPKLRWKGLSLIMLTCLFEVHVMQAPCTNSIVLAYAFVMIFSAIYMLCAGVKKVSPSLYERYSKRHFGVQTVMSLQLCSMMKPKDEAGYYHVEHAVTLGK